MDPQDAGDLRGDGMFALVVLNHEVHLRLPDYLRVVLVPYLVRQARGLGDVFFGFDESEVCHLGNSSA